MSAPKKIKRFNEYIRGPQNTPGGIPPPSSPISPEVLVREEEKEKSVIPYNKSLLQIPPEVRDHLQLLGNRLMVRLFRIDPRQSADSGLVLTPKMTTYVGDSGRPKTELDNFDFQHRGVVVSISPYCSEGLLKILKVGDIVALRPDTNLRACMRWLETDNLYAVFDNYFVIDENKIDWICR